MKIENLEIFRAGDYGEKGSWTPEHIAAIAASYDPKFHEAPVTVEKMRAYRAANGELQKNFLNTESTESTEKNKGGSRQGAKSLRRATHTEVSSWRTVM